MASHRRPRRPPRRPAPEVRKAPAPIVETHIDRLANSGEGIGQAPDGRTLFVPGTAPGDRVRVRLDDVRRTFARGVLIDVVEAGAERVDPPCPVADTCGGCQWQHLDYPAQVRAKAHIVRDALERIGGLTDIGDVPIESSPEAFGYRGRARVRVERGRPGFRAARSHQHVPIEDCSVLAGPLRAALRAFASTRHEDGLWEFALGAPDARHPDGVRVARLGAAVEDTGEDLTLAVGTHAIRLAPGGFAQANPLLFEAMVEAVTEAAGTGDTLLELYAGAGFLSLPLARSFARLVAVESVDSAVDRLQTAARSEGLEGLDARCEDVEVFLSKPSIRNAHWDVLCMDPPRSGLGEAVATQVSRLDAERILYLSCDPATLARDLRVLTAKRWRLANVRAFDQFPQTPHVETLATLVRG